MKSLHFCTPLKWQVIINPKQKQFWTIRTGWIPSIFIGDLIKINKRTTKKPPHDDTLMCYGRVYRVTPVKFKDLPSNPENTEEIARYGKKFNPEQYFFHIIIAKTKNPQKTLF